MKIKNILFIILTIGLFNISYGQNDIKIKKSENDKLIKVLNNCVLLSKTRTNDLSIRVFQTDNEPGSAGFDNCEITHNLLITVSELDEYANQSLFEVESMLNPKFIEWKEKNKVISCIIEHGIYDNRKTVRIDIKINELKIIETKPSS